MPGLLPIMAEKAVNQQNPVVLVDEASGVGFVAVLSLGPCILAWPLTTAVIAENTFLFWALPGKLEELFIADPFSVTQSTRPCARGGPAP